jgi:peptide/nickel transport system permease protein
MTALSRSVGPAPAAAARTGGPVPAAEAREQAARAALAERRDERLRQWRRLMANPLTRAGVLVLALLLAAAAAAPLLATHDPLAQDLSRALRPPGAAHWFGTDEFGRDLYSRVLHGARITLYIVALVTLIVGPVGLAVGVVAGWYGGRVDALLMRVTDIFLSFPSLVLALAFVAALGPGLDHAVIAIALTAWPPIARLARAETLTLRRADFIVAVRLQGAGAARILWRHLVPLCLPSVVVRLTMNMAGIILTAAGLGFLGLGAQAPTPEWGAMVSEGRRTMMEAWWTVAAPGGAILLVSLAFNLLGDGLYDLMDARAA